MRIAGRRSRLMIATAPIVGREMMRKSTELFRSLGHTALEVEGVDVARLGGRVVAHLLHCIKIAVERAGADFVRLLGLEVPEKDLPRREGGDLSAPPGSGFGLLLHRLRQGAEVGLRVLTGQRD